VNVSFTYAPLPAQREVKDDPIRVLERQERGTTLGGRPANAPYALLRYDFVLAPDQEVI
jgi:hypothetical protein